MRKKILAFILAFVMILGTVNPAIAAEVNRSFTQGSNEVGSESTSKNGKLRLSLNTPREDKSPIEELLGGLELGGNLFGDRVGAGENTDPNAGMTQVKVQIEKYGIGNRFFDFEKVFEGQTAEVKLVYDNLDTDEYRVVETQTINADTAEVIFNETLPMADINTDDPVYLIEFNVSGGTALVAKLYVDSPGDLTPQEGTNITNATLELFQVRNTQLVVKTESEAGETAANPKSESVGSQINFTAGTINNKFDIPKDSTKFDLFTGVGSDRITTTNVNQINSGLNFSFTQTENNVLVDRAGNKVYKVKEIYVDSEGLKPSEITLVEKPQVSTDDKYATDPDYVKVDFSAGKYGEIPENNDAGTQNHSVYYVFRNTTLANTLTPPEVKPNTDFTLKTEGTWEPALKNKYDQNVTHVAQYTYEEDVVPQNPMDPRPSVPDNYVMVTFVADAHGSIKDFDKTIYWVNPEASVSFIADEVPGVTPEKGYHFDDWYVGAEKQDPKANHQYTEATRYVAKFESDISDEDKEGFVKVTFKPGDNGSFNPAGDVSFYIKSGKDVDISSKVPTVEPKTGYIHTGWKDGADAIVDLQAVNIDAEAVFTAQYNLTKISPQQKNLAMSKLPLQQVNMGNFTVNQNSGSILPKKSNFLHLMF